MENSTSVNGDFNHSDFNLHPDVVYQHFLNNNYVVMSLYVPVILLALAANTLVILVVVKYNFMRR